jgi:hypothetical protein
LLGGQAGVALRRWLMPRTRCHLYFRVVEPQGVVEVVAAWGASMGRLPPLAKAPR